MPATDVIREFDVRDYIRKELFPHFLCPGCGHGIALRALLWAVDELGIEKDRLAVVSGIGCSGRLSAYIDANTVHVTHGRPLPLPPASSWLGPIFTWWSSPETATVSPSAATTSSMPAGAISISLACF